MKERKHTILRQITGPFIVFMIVLIIANAVALGLYSTSYYLDEQYNDASKLAKIAVGEYESYKSLGWLFEYWEHHYSEMDLVYNNEELYQDKDYELRHLQPDIGDLKSVTSDELERMDSVSQKLFAELLQPNAREPILFTLDGTKTLFSLGQFINALSETVLTPLERVTAERFAQFAKA